MNVSTAFLQGLFIGLSGLALLYYTIPICATHSTVLILYDSLEQIQHICVMLCKEPIGYVD